MLRTIGLAFALLLGVATTSLVRADPPTPDQVVQGLANDLDKAIDGHKAELKKNHEKLIQLIDSILLPHFDIDYASILVLGPYARTATPAQRVRFAKAFYSSLAHRYAEGLLNYTRGSVRVRASKGNLSEKRTIVRTEVVLDDGKTVAVDYAFRRGGDGEWKAYDVIIEGISYITNYRNQVGAEIQKVGLDALTTRLETQGAKTLETMEHEKGGS